MNSPVSVLYVNGRFYKEDELTLSALDRGFTLGDGVFETMFASHQRIFRWQQHLERLRQGAFALEIPLPSEEKLTAAIHDVLSRLQDSQAALRLTVTRGIDKGRGIGFPVNSSPTVTVRAVSMSSQPPEAYENGWRAAISSIRRNESSPLSSIKSCNYGDSMLARREAQKRGYDEALMLNSRGEAACASVANLFVVADGKLQTPPVSVGILPGITRACVLELAALSGITVNEAPFSTDMFFQCGEAFLTNTLIGVMPLVEVERNKIGSGRPGALTKKLAAAYHQMLEAETSPL